MKTALALLFFASLASCQQVYDVILSGGKIVDGTGNQWFYGDLAISGNRIAKIAGAGQLDGASAKERIDVRGLVVAPGLLEGFWVSICTPSSSAASGVVAGGAIAGLSIGVFGVGVCVCVGVGVC